MDVRLRLFVCFFLTFKTAQRPECHRRRWIIISERGFSYHLFLRSQLFYKSTKWFIFKLVSFISFFAHLYNLILPLFSLRCQPTVHGRRPTVIHTVSMNTPLQGKINNKYLCHWLQDFTHGNGLLILAETLHIQEVQTRKHWYWCPRATTWWDKYSEFNLISRFRWNFILRANVEFGFLVLASSVPPVPPLNPYF